MAILGDVGEPEPPQVPRRARRRVGEGGGLQPDLPGLHRPDARERLEQLRLAVAGDAGDADDFSPPHREAHALDALDPEPVFDHEVRHLEHGLAGARGRLVDAQAHCAADHQLGELLGRRLGGGQGRDDPALPHHGDDVGGFADLAELVRDEEHGLALVAERREDAEEVVGLLRRQDGGGLVEDEHLRATVERLEDLDALAVPHAEVRDARIGIDLQMVLAAEPGELGARAAHAGAEPEAALDAEHHVLEDRERLHQHEVLVHHADTRGERVLSATDDRGPAAHEDLAAIRLVVAIEDAHQSRLAGAVLPHDTVNRPRPHHQRDIAVRMNRPEPLVHPPQLDRRGNHAIRYVPLRNRPLRAAALPPQSWGRHRRGPSRPPSESKGGKAPLRVTSPCSR